MPLRGGLIEIPHKGRKGLGRKWGVNAFLTNEEENGYMLLQKAKTN